MDTEPKYGDSKTEIEYDSVTNGPSDWDTVHAQHQSNELMDQRLRAYIHDRTNKENPDRWEDDEPVEYYEDMHESFSNKEDDEEGYNVAEHPDSPEDEFRDEDRS